MEISLGVAVLLRPVDNGAREHMGEEKQTEGLYAGIKHPLSSLPSNLEVFCDVSLRRRDGMREERYMRVKPFPAKCHCSHSGWSLTFLSVSEQTPPLPLLSVCPLSVLQEECPSPHCPPATEEKKKRDVPLGLAPKRLLRPQRQLPSIKERAWPE